MLFGLIILAIGLIFLLRNLGVITGEVWHIVWPSLLIVIALRIIFRKKREKGGWNKFGEKMEDFGEEMRKKFSE